MKGFVSLLTFSYLMILLGITVMMHTRLNEYWFVTLWLFSPRWVAVLPMVLLLPLTLWFRPKMSWVYLVLALLICFPILGYELNNSGNVQIDGGRRLAVLTCNLGGGTVDLVQLADLIRQRDVGLVCLQECTAKNSEILFSSLGWNRRHKGNMAIGSIHPLGKVGVHAEYPKAHFFAKATIGCDVLIPGQRAFYAVSIHLPTFRPALEELRRFRLDAGPGAMAEMADKYRSIAKQAADSMEELSTPVVIAGDFNVPTESVFYREFWDSKINAFSAAGTGLGHTKFTRWHGVRIDHILSDASWTPVHSEVCPDVGSDHHPVIAELLMAPSKGEEEN
jgi:endonuclease/exonuclease/phosphatase (EEP) superfamily protein YafD